MTIAIMSQTSNYQCNSSKSKAQLPRVSNSYKLGLSRTPLEESTAEPSTSKNQSKVLITASLCHRGSSSDPFRLEDLNLRLSQRAFNIQLKEPSSERLPLQVSFVYILCKYIKSIN